MNLGTPSNIYNPKTPKASKTPLKDQESSMPLNRPGNTSKMLIDDIELIKYSNCLFPFKFHC